MHVNLLPNVLNYECVRAQIYMILVVYILLIGRVLLLFFYYYFIFILKYLIICTHHFVKLMHIWIHILFRVAFLFEKTLYSLS